MDKTLRNEIAGAAANPFWPPSGGRYTQRDDTLAAKGGARGIWVYDDIERDPFAYAVLQKRKLAVVARDWKVEPASTRLQDRKAADAVRRQLDTLNFDQLSAHLLDAVLKGYAVCEVMWRADGSELVVDRMIPRDARRFVFDVEGRPRLLTNRNMLDGEELPPRKFVVHRFGAKDESPYGLGLGTRLFWPVYFKRMGIQFWLAFSEKYGMPTAKGVYPSGTSEADQQKLLDGLQALSQEAAIIMPEGMSVELLEATRSGINTYDQLCRYMDEQIARAVLSESFSGSESGGALASAAILRNEVRLELVRADADLLSHTLNVSLVRWISELNHPGATPPTVWRAVDAPVDLKAQAERDQIIVGMGFTPSLKYINDTYGGEWIQAAQAIGEPARGALANPAETPGSPVDGQGEVPAFADPDSFPDQVALDEAVAGLSDGMITAQARRMILPLLARVRTAKSPEALLGELAEAYPAMDGGALEIMLERLIFAAMVWGRLSAEEESGNA